MKKKETAVLIGITCKGETQESTQEHLDELAFLAQTAGAEPVKSFTQRLEHPHPKTFIGAGKLNEVKSFVKENQIDMVIFDDELAPAQIKNIEKDLECKLLDRTNLILDIFASHAQTAQAKTQVELAQCRYLLPRLTRMWTHHSRQKGGIGTKGPGETELETDRRMIRNKIALLKEKLKKIDRQNITRRKHRGQKIRVALVGYTNTGKSTIMNLLSKSDILSENKLFATLDTTVRKVVHERVPYLLSDTVGFIRKLPHDLVESFKSTLDEVREADILIHVVDISHPGFEQQMRVVHETLKDLDSGEKPVLLVFNKTDKLPASFFADLTEKEDSSDVFNWPEINGFNSVDPEKLQQLQPDERLELLKNSYISKKGDQVVFISALQKHNIDLLRNTLINMVITRYRKVYPYSPFIEEK